MAENIRPLGLVHNRPCRDVKTQQLADAIDAYHAHNDMLRAKYEARYGHLNRPR